MNKITIFLAALIFFMASFPLFSETWEWQKPQAKIIDRGDLEWSPEKFAFTPGKKLCHIDFDSGSDDNDGSRNNPWKHHPWDPAASGNAKAARPGIATYVFKCGVVYRGTLNVPPDAAGTEAEPIRLTMDPGWGKGPAVLAGSEKVSGWEKGGHLKSPETEKIWHADLPFAPRAVWMVSKDGTIRRLNLARTPNWKWDKPEDIMDGWWQWEQPEWWTEKNKTQIGKTKMHLGIDSKHLTESEDYYKDATVWTEWGIVMGSPFASKVEGFVSSRKALAFQGFWWGDSGKIITGNRYYLEDKPQFLDEAGEFWFEKKGAGGRLFVRLHDDVDPNSVQVEAASRPVSIEAKNLRNIEISGLVFRFHNIFWDITQRVFISRDLRPSAIRLVGSGDGINVKNCIFEHTQGGIELHASGESDRIGAVTISDNEFRDLDKSAIYVRNNTAWAKSNPPFSVIESVNIFRNRLERVGMRGARDQHGTAIEILFADISHIAGNIIEKTGGQGILLHTGKGSGQLNDKPLTRTLIHHNKVVDTMLLTNDWGGIEIFQGGYNYWWSNISENPGGYWNWAWKNNSGKPKDQIGSGASRQGYAYYLDGSFKNYLFNNIAAGHNNEPGDPRCNAAAFQEIISFQNTFFNNTAYRFDSGSRRQAPEAGMNKWLGNIFDDMSIWLWINAEVKTQKEGNAADAGVQKDVFAYDTNAFGSNVFHKMPRNFGVFRADGAIHGSFGEFAAALKEVKALRSDVGTVSDNPVLTAPGKGDFRPIAGSPATGAGVKVFVPWGLYANVGEWHFTVNRRDPARILDEHWYMTDYYANREDYWKTPRTHLTAIACKEDNFVDGPLEDWTKGALELDGKSQYCMASAREISAPYKYEFKADDGKKTARIAQGVEIASPEIGTHNFLIEVYFRTSAKDGLIAGKMDGQNGYSLEISDGKPLLTIRTGGASSYTACSEKALNDGSWHHLLAELDRKTGAAIYIDGVIAPIKISGTVPASSLVNTGDFLVGGGPGMKYLACTIDFLRICRGTLKDARTTAAELLAWELDGPQYGDFTGRKPAGKRDAGAIQGTVLAK